MEKQAAKEAEPICRAVMMRLLAHAPTQGRAGSDLRTAVGDFLAQLEWYLLYDEYGPPVKDIFDQARAIGVDLEEFEDVRKVAFNYLPAPKTVGAKLAQNSLIEFTLVEEAQVIGSTVFTSREDVDAVKKAVNAAFDPMEELAADDMDQAAFSALVGLHAAVAFHLAEVARPLPRMLSYAFYNTLSSLVIGYKLYSDASRCDEIRAENKIIHPAFCPMEGRALSG
jgi:hypothetical protein